MGFDRYLVISDSGLKKLGRRDLHQPADGKVHIFKKLPLDLIGCEVAICELRAGASRLHRRRSN